MKCPNCGSDVPDSSKFCTKCGTLMGEQTIQMPEVPMAPQAPVTPGATEKITVPPPAVPSLPPPVFQPPPVQYDKSKKSKTTTIIIAVVIGVLILGGAAAGIIIWRVSVANQIISKVISMDLSRSDGEELDLEKVPLDTELKLEAVFRAKYPGVGKATLKMFVRDSSGESIIDHSYTVKSSGDTQKKSFEFHMTQSQGKPLEAVAELRVVKDDKKVSDTESLEYTAIAGKGEELQLDEAKQSATDKLQQATNSVKEITGMGIDSADLVNLLSDAVNKLQAATTAADANAVYTTAEAVIKECETRKAKQQSDAQARATCKANQATLWTAINAYGSNGNYPDQLSMLVDAGYLSSLPQCPSGGVYSYNVDYFSGPTENLTVSCSVHGSL